MSKKLPKVYLELSVDDILIGRIVIELRSDVVPKTTTNFLHLCKGTYGYGYAGSIFHRMVDNAIFQGGDFEHLGGKGGYSIYKKRRLKYYNYSFHLETIRTFKDENFILKHSEPGVVSMANCGKHTNGSQFFFLF